MSHAHRFDSILKTLQPLRNALLEHPLYGQIQSLKELRVFMQHHIFAVWDFMSLLQSLQTSLCGQGTPWTPPADSFAARMINEIVLAEETDEDGQGGFDSHFGLYRRSMVGCVANTDPIDQFIVELRNGRSVDEALVASDAPLPVRQFVADTFTIIRGGNLCSIASAFTFGREDLLPDVFQRIVDELNIESGGGLKDFQYYLSRHIELDGDHHGPMARRLIESLCGTDEANWLAAEAAAVKSLEARLQLWNGIAAAMEESQASAAVVD